MSANRRLVQKIGFPLAVELSTEGYESYGDFALRAAPAFLGGWG